MQQQLYNIQPKRLFTFGCSFTNYTWGTWANCLAQELGDIEFVNLGRSGAGNHYIFNTLMQADALYDFTHEDLVVVQWTNVCREDRFLPQNKSQGPWVTPGNIYSQEVYNEEFVRKYFSEEGAYVRDLAFIKAAYEMLKHKAQWHFLQMCDIIKQPNQWDDSQGNFDPRETSQRLDDAIKFYHEPLSFLRPSFYEILWHQNLQTKFSADRKLISKNFFDGHPSPLEHYKYLKGVFKHNWKNETDRQVEKTQEVWIKLLRDASKDKKGFNVSQMKQRWQDMLFYETKVKGPSYMDQRLLD